ncbi:MAG: ABC transporter ATP-binding protein [Clostridia bacterium]|nr:ABC transporter ATP-binding protein [Clostridia bacterium]
MSGRSGKHGPMGMLSVEKPKAFKSTLKRLIRYFQAYRLYLLVIGVVAGASTLFSVLAPKVMSIGVNSIETMVEQRMQGLEPAMDYPFIFKVLGGLMSLYLVSSALQVWEYYLMANVSQNIVRQMRSEVQQKLTRLPLAYFDRVTHGEVLSRAVGDVGNIASSLQESVVQVVTGTVTLVGVFLMMVLISKSLTLVVLLSIPMYFFIAKPIIFRAQKLFNKRQKSNGELNSIIEEMYAALRTVKAYGKEEATKAQFQEINEAYCDAGWKAQFITGIIMPLTTFISNLSYVLVCIASGLLFAAGKITLGDVAAFLMYVKLFSGPVNQMTSISNAIQSSIASAERIFEILDAEEEQEGDLQDPVFEDGEVVFDHIDFSYSEDQSLIEDLHLHVKDGEMVAIVGPTGAGKTTLVNLLMRFYDLKNGVIRIGGIDTAMCRRSDVRAQFGMVLQDTWLFNGTIMENIRYGNALATDDACIEAAKKAQAHHFITTLPDSYDTVLNEEATNISQGEKQLITIARTLLHNPKILILDEATSNVDTLTEQRIQDGMAAIMKDRTCFIIAHRLSTIKNAHNILVMDKGQIVETGTHDVLMKQKGAYARLYQAQFANVL